MVTRESDRTEKQRQQLFELMRPREHENHERAAKRLSKARELFHDILAEQLEGPINERIAKEDFKSHHERQDLAKWINAELRSLGLAIRCPNTGKATFLTGHARRHRPDGEFQLCDLAKQGTNVTFTSTERLQLDLMGYCDRGTRGAWAERTHRPTSRQKNR